MKTFLNIPILLILLNNISLPQFYADSTISDDIVEFMRIVNENSKQNDPYKGLQKAFTDEELEHIAELYYKCYNDDPVGFQKYVNEKHQEWKKAPLEVTSGKIKMRPWLKVYALRDRIRYKYGITFTEVIGTPAFIRARFDLEYQSKIYITELKSNWSLTNYVFLIEEVIKGNKFFRSGNECTISYSPNAEAPVPEIEKGKSYLIPITTWVGQTDYNGEVSFGPLRKYYDRWQMGEPPKTFPIENEIIKDCEYFGINDTSWTDFIKYFKETYLIFE